jgi:hypothetical protein
MTRKVNPPQRIILDGEWKLAFPKKEITINEFKSWTESDEEYIKHFSGSATYSRTVDFSRISAERVVLDLGTVHEIAEVFIDGKPMATCWMPEKRLDITEVAAQNRPVKLEIRVTNLLANRMIGDQSIPEVDVNRKNGVIQAFPQWYLDGKPIPGGRSTFASWELYNRNDPLLPSGILRPVTIEYETKTKN